MTNNTYLNNKKAYFLNHTKLRFSQKKGLIFKESLIKKKKVSKQNSFIKAHPCTRSLNNFPAVKAGTRLAGIAIFSPVLGFNP